MNREYCYKVFFAFPFDAATKSMYDSILQRLKKDGYGKRFDFVYGTNTVVNPSPDYSNIDAFKAQNRDLLEQFQLQIRSSDIIVADLTHNNPNVHVELGIAINLNKNILRVSGRELGEVGSDVKGYEVHKYNSMDELLSKIENYLDCFLKIKALPLSETAPTYKAHFPVEQPLGEKKFGEIPVQDLALVPGLRLRDGEIKVRFKFIETKQDVDWFGIFLRSTAENPWIRGYLIYVRKNGKLEIAVMPTRILNPSKEYPALVINREYLLHARIDGSNLIASLDDEFEDSLQVKDLDVQSPGNIIIGSYQSHVVFRQVEVVCRDTVDFSI